jgi:hypothetical protein
VAKAGGRQCFAEPPAEAAGSTGGSFPEQLGMSENVRQNLFCPSPNFFARLAVAKAIFIQQMAR